MTFPVSPTNGQVTTVNGITYTYNSTDNAWSRTAQPVGNLTVSGNVTVGRTLSIDNTGDVSANIGAYQTYANSNAVTQSTSINIVNANLGAYQTWANTSITSLYTNANANTAAYLTTYTGNIQAGNISVTGNVNVTSNVFANKLYTTNGLYWAGNGNVISTGGGGGTFTASNTTPSSASPSDFWYYVAGDILFQYINDGDSSQWVDTSSPVAPTSTVVSDLVLSNVSISSVYNVNSTLTALGLGTTANLTIGNVITGIVTATGNVNAANLTTTGNVVAGNLITGIVTAGGNITASNVVTGIVTASGNITASNVVTGIVTASGNITASNVVTGIVTASGNITASNVVTGIVTASGNITASNVVTGIVTATGNVTAVNITTLGNVQASYIQGNGSKLTNLNAASTGKAIAMAIVFGG